MTFLKPTLAALAFALCLGGLAEGQTILPGGGGGGTPVTSANGGTGVANTGNWTWNAAQTWTVTSGQTMTLPAASTTLAGLGTVQSFTAANTFSAAGAASTPGLTVSGARFTGGSGTTTFPQTLLQETGATASTTWSTSGTAFGINMHTGSGNLLDLQTDGSSKLSVDSGGGLTAAGGFTIGGNMTVPAANVYLFLGRGTISSPAAGGIQLGNTDAAAPVAQTLSAQSVVAGTSNTAGVALTITGSRGTGTGAGGSLIFQISPAGTTGTAQNALTTALTLDSAQLATFTGSISIPAAKTISWVGSPTLYAASTTALCQSAAGPPTFFCWNNSTGFDVINTGYVGWSNSGDAATGTVDLFLTRKAAATIQLGRADAAVAVAQTFGVQSVVAGTSNVAGANLTHVGSLSTGSGVSGDIIFRTGGTGAGATAQNAAVNALVLKGATQAVQMPGLASSSSAQTGTVCWTTATGNLTVDTTTTCLLSDMRLKKNMKPLLDAEGLPEIMAMRPFSYDLKSDPMHAGRQVGLGAQDVQKIDPRLVALYDHGPDAGTPRGVRYEQLTALLVKAIQQQEAEITALKAQIANHR